MPNPRRLKSVAALRGLRDPANTMHPISAWVYTLGLGHSTIYRYIDDGIVMAVKRGGRRYISEDEISEKVGPFDRAVLHAFYDREIRSRLQHNQSRVPKSRDAGS
jgi:hypothetical protein